ncbi:hypothetical protein [Pedobacter hartonius]|nr:hypothetical protein [Pedobacter hartonius]
MGQNAAAVYYNFICSPNINEGMGDKKIEKEKAKPAETLLLV